MHLQVTGCEWECAQLCEKCVDLECVCVFVCVYSVSSQHRLCVILIT